MFPFSLVTIEQSIGPAFFGYRLENCRRDELGPLNDKLKKRFLCLLIDFPLVRNVFNHRPDGFYIHLAQLVNRGFDVRLTNKAHKSWKEPIQAIVLDLCDIRDFSVQISAARKTMRVIHCHESDLTSLIADKILQEYIVVVEASHSQVWMIPIMSITVADPGIKNDQTSNIRCIHQFGQFPFGPAPRMSHRGSRDKRWSRRRLTSPLEGYFVNLGVNLNDREVKCGQSEPSSQTGCYEFTSQRMRPLSIAKRLDVCRASICNNSSCPHARV